MLHNGGPRSSRSPPPQPGAARSAAAPARSTMSRPPPPEEAARLAPELYFLVARLLLTGPLQETARALRRELETHRVLPVRRDWLGATHHQTLEELEQQYPHVRSHHLLEVCANLVRRGEREPRVSLLSGALAGRPAAPARTPHNVVERLLRRAAGRAPPLCAPPGPALLSPRVFSGLQLQRRTLGHLSAVYCVQFDRTGAFIITGADDLLVKVWSAADGRLLLTCRGAASEITDVCVSRDNRLLCAGSLDRLIRVWDAASGAPVAVLQGHSGMITSVHFCPARAGDLRCLVSTSTDGSVAFWTYSQSGQHGKVNFISKPVQYMERMRPGTCHMICCCWSPGGAFLAAGSADHHVRVYMMAEQGPKRILEVAAHSDAVDSLAWCNRGLRFVSGSKDGTAILWQLHAMQWRHTTLHMTARLPGEGPEPDEGKRVKVTMVCWDCKDTYIITAASDHTIKVWCARTCRLVRVLRGHDDETYVLEAHPFLSTVLLSAGHDGQVIVWDLEGGVSLKRFLNRIEGQGHGAVFDAKWCPDGSRLAGTDSHGHLLLWGLGRGHPDLRTMPTELFFHTDYRPLARDALGGVLDEQTQAPPHLMPPPFLVDVEGAPHAPRLQRLVPGRENLTLSQLIPLTGPEVGGDGGADGQPRSQIDLIIEELARQWRQDEHEHEHEGDGDGDRREPDGGGGARGGGAAGAGAAGTVWRGEGVRHTEGVRQRGEPLEERARRPAVPPLAREHHDRLDLASEEMSQLEMWWYRREMRRRPQMISTAEAGAPCGPRRRAGRGARAPRRPPAPSAAPPADRRRPTTPDYYDEEEESEERVTVDSSDTSDSSVRLSGADRSNSSGSSDHRRRRYDSSSSSSDYSDWAADRAGHALAPPERSKRRPVARTRYSPATTPSKRPPAAPHAPPAPDAPADAPDAPADAPDAPDAPMPVELPEAYRPGEWLCAVAPRKAPYHPQMGDECLYFKLGHQRYFEAVSEKDVYKMNARDKPWERTHINECEPVKVVGVKYLIRPPRLVCLKLAVLDGSARSFTVKYHDMADVIDFLVLRQQYAACVERRWAAGDRFRCMIDDMWWTGAVVEVLGAPRAHGEGQPAGGGAGAGGEDGEHPAADAARHFLSLRVRWDNGEYERMSPWDLEPIDESRLPAEVGGCCPVLAAELEAVLYRPRADEWPPEGDRARACRRIARHMDQVMGLSIAEPFVAPVDLNVYPSYAYVVEYPIDLSTIKGRFENHFYRRAAAAQFDVRYLATNAEKFNRPHSAIVRQARILTDLLLAIIGDWREVDVASAYHALAEAYCSSDSDGAARRDRHDRHDRHEPGTSGGGARRRRRAGGSCGSWGAECARLMRELMSRRDAEPFLRPVGEEQAPDYRAVVAVPMDLGTVRSRLQMGQYAAAEHFARDVRLVFSNSRLYNTNERSRIYSMTLRMGTLFEELFKNASRAWRRRQSRRRRAGPGPAEEYATSDEETLAATSRRKRTRRGGGGAGGGGGGGATDGHARDSDSLDSDAPLTRGKGKGVGKKSKKSEASSAAATPEGAADARVPALARAHEAVLLAEDSPSSEYEQLEVLEEPARPQEDEEGEAEEGGAGRGESTADEYRPPSRSDRPRGRHRVRLKRARKRRRSSSERSDSAGRRRRRRRRRPPPARRPRTKRRRRGSGAAGARSPPEPSLSSNSSGSSGSSGSPREAREARGAAREAHARYESDHSYRPRLSSDDSAPLHTYRRTPTEGAEAGPSHSRRVDRAQHAQHAQHHQHRGRSRRSLPELRYNEDSEEDSIAAISKRLREHATHRARGVRAGAGAAPHAADHTYHNGHRPGGLAPAAAPLAPRARHPPAGHHPPHRHHLHHRHNGDASDGGDDEPLSISSRGRVRKLTAKARGLLRE